MIVNRLLFANRFCKDTHFSQQEKKNKKKSPKGPVPLVLRSRLWSNRKKPSQSNIRDSNYQG